MTAAVHTAGHWAAAHRTALLVLLVAAVLAAAITVVTVRLVGAAVPVPSGATTPQVTQQITPGDDSCSLVKPGLPC